MSIWGRVFAAGYDSFMAASEEAGLRDYRRSLLAPLTGRLLEIGGGTGANLPFYGEAVEELVVTEPEEPMARRLERKVESGGPRARVVRAPAERLPFEDGVFDFVVSTLVLCTVGDPAAALAQIHRLLKPGGELIFLERVRSDDPALARWQDRLHGVWRVFGCGCHCNRPTLDTIASNGFILGDVTHDRMPKAPAIVRPLVAGSARRA